MHPARLRGRNVTNSKGVSYCPLCTFFGKTYFQSRNETLKNLHLNRRQRLIFQSYRQYTGFHRTRTLHTRECHYTGGRHPYPQVDSTPAPTIVPAGLTRIPHIRSPVASPTSWACSHVEDRGDHISVRSKNAPSSALDAIHRRFPGHAGMKACRYHRDYLGCGVRRVRNIERAHGGYAFFYPVVHLSPLYSGPSLAERCRAAS